MYTNRVCGEIGLQDHQGYQCCQSCMPFYECYDSWSDMIDQEADERLQIFEMMRMMVGS